MYRMYGFHPLTLLGKNKPFTKGRLAKVSLMIKRYKNNDDINRYDESQSQDIIRQLQIGLPMVIKLKCKIH